jgi:DNA polymerase I-like protein with 3'-5' exonuclease and polymerase domains
VNRVIALDIETTGLDHWKDEILMVGLWTGKEYICLRSKEDTQQMLSNSSMLSGLCDHEIVCHNAQFDIKFLEVKGWWKPDGRVIHDTQIMASLLSHKVPKSFLDQYEADRKVLAKQDKTRKLRQAGGTSLKVLAPYYLQVPRFWESASHDDEEYNRLDCKYTYELFELFSTLLDGNVREFYLKMLEWSKMVRAMEVKGVSVSEAALSKKSKEYAHDSLALETELRQRWRGETIAYRTLRATEKNKPIEKIPEFNFASPKQMKWLFKDRFGLDISVSADSDEESTNKAVLNRLAAEGRDDIKTFLEWRKATKILTAYLPSYKELMNESTLHPSFSLTGTRTGRTSSSRPNLQQVPETLLDIFRPRPEHKFIKFDLSGIEAAIIALYSGDKTLYDLLESGESLHSFAAKEMFKLPCKVSEVAEKFPAQRRCAKTVGFADFYGAGARRIKASFEAAGFSLSLKEAKKIQQQRKALFPCVFSYHRECTAEFESGVTIYNLLGRPVTIQPWENPYMQGFNTLVQSSASDLNLEACYRYWNDFKGNPIIVIHDCIIAEERAEVVEERAEALQKCMTEWTLTSEHGNITLRVEGGVADLWEK